MSYLNVPRIHFAGTFQADPSTVNNNDANFDPTVTLKEEPPNPADPTNTSVYWNPYGTHNWQLEGCTVRGAVDDNGKLPASGADPIVGAKVLSVSPYPAKIVDLDPDNQGVSQIWGLQVQIQIPDPTDSTKVLASVTGTMPPSAFGDLWNRAAKAQPGMPTMCAAFQAVLQSVTWVNPSASPVLAALQALSPTALSIRFNVDSFQPDQNQSNFTYGRVVGTIGPALPNEAPRSTPRRMAPVFSGQPSIMSKYGPAGCVWDAKRSVLIIDLGNSVPTDGTPPVSGPTVPVAGWPVITTTLQLNFGATSAAHAQRLKSGAPLDADPPPILINFDTNTYLTQAGVVEVAIDADRVSSLLSSPITLVDTSTSTPAVQEDSLGRYVDLDIPFFRLNPGDTSVFTLWATKFGQPWSGAGLDLALQPAGTSNNGPQWNNGDPQSAVNLSTGGTTGTSSLTVTTQSNGTAAVTLIAGDPKTPRMYSDGQPGPDGQVYWVSGSWASWGQIFLFSGGPVNILVFSGYPLPATPNWTQHVQPILGIYARMYPYMKGIIDIGDYATVIQNISGIDYVLNLPATDPHHMPVVRDLSGGKLAMINLWIKNGTPESAP